MVNLGVARFSQILSRLLTHVARPTVEDDEPVFIRQRCFHRVCHHACQFVNRPTGAQLKEDGWLIPGTNNLTVQRRIRGIPRLWQLKADFLGCDDCDGGSMTA